MKQNRFTKDARNTKHSARTYQAPTCPYCGGRGILRPVTYLYGDHTFDKTRYAYVCENYEKGCDSYVYAAEGSTKPMGTMADHQLRRKRIEAHKAINRIIRSGRMSKGDVYGYLEFKFGFKPNRFHLGESSGYYCDETIKIMDSLLQPAER